MSGQDRDRSRKKSLGCSIIDDLSWGIDNPPISEIPNKQTGGALPISTKKCIDCSVDLAPEYGIRFLLKVQILPQITPGFAQVTFHFLT